MVLVEAMAAGLPIVTTNAPGVCDVIDDNITGIKVQTENPLQLAQATASVLMDREKSCSLSANALELAKKKYDWSVVTSDYAAFYKDILG
jgi:glycosyltransferase involved in cell wall biosynthesis